MKSFFEDLGRRIGETTENVTNKAGEMMEIQRMKSQIRNLESGNEKDMLEMGRRIYERYKSGEQMDEKEMQLCEAIKNREESIEKYQMQIEKVKGSVSCGQCGKSVSKDMIFCPYCGAKMSDETSKEEQNYAEEIKEKVADFAERAGEKAEKAVGEMEQKTADMAETVKEKTAEATDTIKEKTAEAADAIKEKTTEAADAIKEKTTEAADKIKKFTEE